MFDGQYFIINRNDDIINVALKSDIDPLAIADKTNLEFIIAAKIGLDTVDSHVVLIDLPKEICKQTPIFEKPLYEGELNVDLSLRTVEAIILAPDTKRDELTFELSDSK